MKILYYNILIFCSIICIGFVEAVEEITAKTMMTSMQNQELFAKEVFFFYSCNYKMAEQISI